MGLDSDPKSPELPALTGKLPLAFKTPGFGAHAAFDRMAKDAAAKAAPEDLLRQLGGTLQKCASCHDRYGFGTPAARQASRGMLLAGRPEGLHRAGKY